MAMGGDSLFPEVASGVNPWSIVQPIGGSAGSSSVDKYMQAPSQGGGGGGGDSKGIDLGSIIKLIGSLAL